MFKELSDRFKKGTINLSITMNEGIMSVMVTFKGLPSDIRPRVFTGSPKEIEDIFFESMEQPLAMVSSFNKKMDDLEKALQEKLKEKEKEVAGKTAKPADPKKPAENKPSLDFSAKKEEPRPEPEEIPDIELGEEVAEEKPAVKQPIKMTEAQKQECIAEGMVEDPFEAHEKVIEKIMELNGTDRESAKKYFENNLRSTLNKRLEEKIKEDEKHAGNVARLKEEAIEIEEPEASTEEKTEMDPFAEDEDDFNL